MIIVKGNFEKLNKSEFYNKECWDYPKEEIDMLKKEEIYSDVVYLISNNRLYETTCDMNDLEKLLTAVDGEILNIQSKEKEQAFADVVNLFMEKGDKPALNKLYEITNDNLVKQLIDLYSRKENNTEKYEKLMELVWNKYNLNNIEDLKYKNMNKIFDNSFFREDILNDIFDNGKPVSFDRFFERVSDDGEIYDIAFEELGSRSETNAIKIARKEYKEYKEEFKNIKNFVTNIEKDIIKHLKELNVNTNKIDNNKILEITENFLESSLETGEVPRYIIFSGKFLNEKIEDLEQQDDEEEI